LRKAPANLLPDVVHAWPLGALETIRAAKERGVAVVLERPNAHTAFAYSVVEAESRKLGVPVSEDNPHHADPKRLEREEAEYDAADALLCPSDFVRQTFVDQGVNEAKLVRHRYGYDAARFKPAELNGHEPGGLRALFAGRCEPRKGLHYALEAWAESGVGEDGGTLTLCGVFEPAFRAACAKWLELPGVEDAGFVTDIETRMRSSDALVLPSIEEGSALVTYEARACGCLLLVSDAAGAVVADGEDGLLHRPGDVAALAAHYRKLHDDPALRRRMRAASAAVAKDLTWSAAGARLLEAYAETIDRAPTMGR
ncbi:MAG: glycosyltransferase family 4 protein, partial [Planctomycetota bacterium]